MAEKLKILKILNNQRHFRNEKVIKKDRIFSDFHIESSVLLIGIQHVYYALKILKDKSPSIFSVAAATYYL